jgi:predicted alpha-1,2-mannosidase
VRRIALTLVLMLGLPAAAHADRAAEVDPMIGTFPPGFVVPGAATPFGMVQNSPDTTGEFAYSGYLYTDPLIRGFSLVHLSGPGVRKGGDISFLPRLGTPTNDPALYATPFTHLQERAEPGYYRVTLAPWQIDVELTASSRAAMQRYTFPPVANARVIMDTARSNEGVADATWRMTGPDEVTGSRHGRYPVFFVARFSRPFKEGGGFVGSGTKAGGWVGFDATRDRTVTVRVGISFHDEAGARRNLEAEAPGFDFDGMQARARAAWNHELAKVQVEGGTPLDRRAFTTALYHSYLHPNVVNDTGTPTRYANFSSWDTYKAQNQLLALTQRERYRDMLRSLLLTAQETGKLPRWGEWTIDAAHMSGDPAVPAIADGYCRGLLDPATAAGLYEAGLALRAARPPDLDRLGYLPGRPGTTLEYGIADFALALMARGLGREADAQRLLADSLRYRNLLDPQTRWIRPRNADGSWATPFDPTDETGFQEGNSWQYSWLVPHDARGLFDRMGGDEVVNRRFATFFAGPAQLQSTLTAMGTVYRLPQYAPGNEHDIQAPWMPAFSGRPGQVAAAHRNARTLFRATIDGLPGNDDLGGLSAWHVFSALGFGPVIPGAPLHVVGSPQFERATIDVGGGRAFTVRAPGNSALTPYVAAAQLDGAPLTRSWISDAAVRAGGTLDLTMRPAPGAWATSRAAAPPSASDTDLGGFGCQPLG